MKAKNLYIAAALCAGTFGVSNVANAQDVFVDDAVSVTEFTCDNSNHYFASPRNNWFIEIGAGAGQPLVEKGEEKAVYGKKWTAAYSVGFGRWMSPYLGLRIKAIGGALHWNSPAWGTSQEAYSWSRAKHVNLQMELMWDMFNSLGGVNENRVFSIIPFVGLGGDAMWDYKNHFGETPAATTEYTYSKKHGERAKSVQWTLPVSAGLQFRLRLSKYVDFFAEARAAFYGDNWNNVSGGHSVDAYVSAMGGFSFNIGGRGWNTFNECNYVSQIAALNGQVNDLRGQLAACGATVAALQAQLPCPEVVEKDCNNAPLMATVRFTINSDKIMPTEEVNVYSMAEWLKANPNEKIVIAGYADKDTGTSEYNMGLSQRRADAVKAELVNTYGIDPSRLETKAFGSDEQEYPSHNDWNRIVIFKQ
ncbi:MAG: OmpA family protein [Bacteroidales bacterium]|nr:OmpA family protein [Bacteroidales bacterium]MBD5223935.1 OmpA family protein [Bacteroidales bacterium]